MFQVIAENLNTAVVSDLNTLAKSIRDDRRKVSEQEAETLVSRVKLIWIIVILQECFVCFCWHARCDLHPQKCFTFDLKITKVVKKCQEFKDC